MNDPKDILKTMLQDLINDRPEQAQVSIHNYIVNKTQEVSGFTSVPAVNNTTETEFEEE